MIKLMVFSPRYRCFLFCSRDSEVLDVIDEYAGCPNKHVGKNYLIFKNQTMKCVSGELS